MALSGERKLVGINQFLGDENSRVSFTNMLIPYESGQDDSEKNHLQIALEKMLEQGRKSLLKADFRIIIAPVAPGAFNMVLSNLAQTFSLPEGISCKCYPITTPENRSKDIAELKVQGKIVFGDLTTEALTGFIAFRLVAKKSGEKAGISFVFNLPVEGMPLERDKYVLHRILSDKETFIRYLLLILGVDDLPGLNKGLRGGSGRGAQGQGSLFPLFEEMVRAYSRDPEKIKRISMIIQDLKEVGNLDDIVPEGFEDIWSAFKGETLKDS